jgi:hypothetical protein
MTMDSVQHNINIVTWHLKGGIVEPEQMAAVRLCLSKHMSAAMDMPATIEELLEAVFSMQSMPRLYSEGHREKFVSHG